MRLSGRPRRRKRPARAGRSDWGLSLRLAGSSTDNGVESIALGRLTSQGVPDPAFSSGTGLVTTSFGAQSGANAIAIQDVGTGATGGRRFLVAGRTLNAAGNTDFALVRYLPSGALDTTFGDGVSPPGMAAADFGGGNDDAFAVSLMSDGSIAVAGTSTSTTGSVMAVAHFSANGQQLSTGTLDFGHGGSSARAMVIVPLSGIDRIYLAGQANNVAGNADFALGCMSVVAQSGGKETLAPDPTLSATVGAPGRVLTDFGGSEGAAAMTLQGTKLVLAGTTTASGAPGNQTSVALVRYHFDGTLDTAADSDPLVSFNSNGKVMVNLGTEQAVSATGTGIATYTDTTGAEKLLVVGPTAFAGNRNLLAIRLTADGQPDNGTAYVWNKAIDLGNNADLPGGLAIDGLGKLVLPALGGAGAGQFMAVRLLY